ncbi:MAG: cell division protein ZapA [Rhodobacteraceae bacterium]|nr:cell division protein ZapA [Paracoccaceae bacterium]
MPEITVTVGDRPFQIVCNDGEEPHLKAAAKMLDAEATTLQAAIGRVPESRMLLMAGLMLADRTKELEWNGKTSIERTKTLEDRLRASEAKAAALAVELANMQEQSGDAGLFGESELPKAMALLEKTASRLEALGE